MPSFVPERYQAVAAALFSVGKLSTITLVPTTLPAASPPPTPRRAATSPSQLCTNPVAADANDQNATAHPSKLCPKSIGQPA